MDVIAGIGDFLVKLTPLMVGLMVYLIPTAKDRMDRKAKQNGQPPVEISTGQKVDYTEDYISLLKEKVTAVEEVERLKRILVEHDIPFEEKEE